MRPQSSLQNSLAAMRKDEKRGVLERAMIKPKECMSKSEIAEEFGCMINSEIQGQQGSFPGCLSLITRWGKPPLTGCMALVKLLNLYIPCLFICQNGVKMLILWASYKCKWRYVYIYNSN